MSGLGRRLVDAVLGPISEHPLRAAGGVAAVLAAAVTLLRVTATTTDGATSADAGLTLAAVADVAAAHPAYPAAVVVGLAVLAFAD